MAACVLLPGCLLGVEPPASVLAHGYGPAPDEGYVDVATSAGYRCALHQTGGTWCAADASIGGPYTAIGAGGFGDFCAIRASDGTLDCLGDTPGEPPSGSFVAVAGGDSHWCAMTSSGDVECWTDGLELFGETDVPDREYAAIGLGYNFSCGARAKNGAIDCWGDLDPQDIPEGSFVALDGGFDQLCAVSTSGSVRCSGEGLGDLSDDLPSGDFVDVSVDHFAACALAADGSVSCWGLDGGSRSPPAGDRFLAVDTSKDMSCGVRTDTTVVCWGDDGDAEFP